LQGVDFKPPSVSQSNKTIAYAHPSADPLISYGAPSLMDIAARRKRKVSTPEKTTRKKHLQKGSKSAQATALPTAASA